jgi:anion-transporting  ArsA/GET3 family ATPase
VKDLLKKGSVVILLGTGGVGKTTIAAALAIAGAQKGLNTAVITVDPAKRLRDALAIGRLSARPTRIGGRQLRAAGLDPALKLSALMLDVKGAWDAMVERFAETPVARRRILDNPFYQSLAAEFAGSDAFAALQQLYDLHQSAAFDFMVVDTPPAAHAFEFLSAPARFKRLLDIPAARWLFAPGSSAGRLAARLTSRAARFVVRELERFAGARVLSTIAEFFAAAAETVEAVVDQLRKTESLLRSREVEFVLVTTAEDERLRQARALIREMESDGLRLAAVVINRFTDQWTWHDLSHADEPAVLDEIAALCGRLARDGKPRYGGQALVSYLTEYRETTLQDIERVRAFTREVPSHVRVAIAPEITPGVADLRTVAQIAHLMMDTTGGGAAISRRPSRARRGLRASR